MGDIITNTDEIALNIIQTDQLLYNTIPSAVDNRDWLMKDMILTKKSPNYFSLKDKLLPIKDAKKCGSCISQALATVIEFHEFIDTGKEEYFSQQFIYDLRKNINVDGMEPRDALHIILRFGICKEKLCPDQHYNAGETPTTEGAFIPYDTLNITNEFKQLAKNYCITCYGKIFTIDELKQTLMNHGPAIIVFPVKNVKNVKGRFWKRTSKKDLISGYHTVVVVGWNKKGFFLRNNWGPKWNGDGHCFYPYSEFGIHHECWGIVDVTSPHKHKKKESSSCIIL